MYRAADLERRSQHNNPIAFAQDSKHESTSELQEIAVDKGEKKQEQDPYRHAFTEHITREFREYFLVSAVLKCLTCHRMFPGKARYSEPDQV